jgi:hypothetical protein
MLDLDTVQTMLESGGATPADIANHFSVPLREVETFLDRQHVTVPNGAHAQYRHVRRMQSGERLSATSAASLLFDRGSDRYINGVDTMGDGRVEGRAIVVHYHGAVHCWFTDESTDAILAVDGNPQNVLISNMMPVTAEIGERFVGEPAVVSAHRFVLGDARVTVGLQGRIDKQYGAAFSSTFVGACWTQWVRPYELYISELHDGPVNAEVLALWVWRQLSTVALVKGLARLDVEYQDVTATLTKELYMRAVVDQLRRAFSARSIATPSSIVVPKQQQPPGSGLIIP